MSSRVFDGTESELSSTFRTGARSLRSGATGIAFSSPSPLQHAWSLSIEEQFYAIWPLIVIGVVAIRRSARTVLAVSVVLGGACAAFAVVAAYRGVDQRLLYYSTMSRAPSLLIGAGLAAVVAIAGPVASRRGRIALEVVAIVSVMYLAWSGRISAVTRFRVHRGPLLLCGLAAVAVIAAAAHPDRGPIGHVLAVRPLVGLGLISYGVYLFHWPVFLVLTPSRTGLSGWWLFAERVAVRIAIALVSYYLIEQPVRRGVPRPTRAIVALGAATAMIATSLVVATHIARIPAPVAAATAPIGSSPTAAPVQFTDVDREFLPPGDWSHLTQRCHAEVPPYVGTPGRTAAPRVLITGDSVACFLGAALEIDQAKDGVVTLNRARVSCVIAAPRRIDSTDTRPVPACIDGQQAAIAAFKPDVAVLLAGGPEAVRYDIGDGKWVSPCDQTFDSWYAAGVRRTIQALSATGATVVVVTAAHPPKGIVGTPEDADRHVDCNNRTLRIVVAVRAPCPAARPRGLHLSTWALPRQHRWDHAASRRCPFPTRRRDSRRAMDASQSAPTRRSSAIVVISPCRTSAGYAWHDAAMRRSSALVACAVLVLAACSSSGGGGGGTKAATSSTPTSAVPATSGASPARA